MSNKLYVGGLSYSTNSAGLEKVFQAVGEVLSAQVITDRELGRSKGFGFVEMGTAAEATDAVTKLNGTDLDGRTIVVNEARAREPRQANTRW